MSLAFSAVKAEPLKVEDPFDAGWKLLCVRDDSFKFSPWSAKAQIAGVVSSTIQVMKELKKELPGGLEGLDAEASVEAQSNLPSDLLARIDRKNAAEAEILESGPRDAESVARLVYGWEGVVDDEKDGAPIPFSKDALLSLLSQEKVGECDLVAKNGDSGPLRLQEGEYATLTVGEALCLHIPAEIRKLCWLESLKVFEKKRKPAPKLSSGDGSGTEKTKSSGRKRKTTRKD